MSGFLNILLNVMNNRRREKELESEQPYRAALTKRLEMQNTIDQNTLSDMAAIKQAANKASSESQTNFVPAEGVKLSSTSNVFNTPGTIQTTKGDPLLASFNKAVELGNPELASKYKQVIDLNDTLQEMAARNKRWGGSQQYYDLKGQLDTASQTGEILNKLYKSGGMPMIKQVLSQNPELQKIVGDPEKLAFTQEGVMHPALHAQTGQPIPNWFYMVDQDGKTKMVEIKPQEEWSQPYEMSVGGKKGLVQKSSTGQIKPVMQDISTTVNVRGGGDRASVYGISDNDAALLTKGIEEGRIDPTKINSRTAKVYIQMEKAAQGQTDYVGAGANVKYKTSAANLQSRALMTGIQPLYDKLLEAGKELNNSNIVGKNRIVNWGKEQGLLGPDAAAKITGFNNLRDDVIAESERVLMGSGVLSDSKYLRAVKNVNSAQSYPQLKAAIANLRTVIKTREEALNVQPFQNRRGTSTKKEQKAAIVNDLRSEFGIGK